MPDLVELKITNNYAGKANNKKKEKTIYIDGDCCITNYGPDGNGKKNGNITMKSKNNNISIFYGRNNKRESSEKAHLSPEKYELLLEIAKLHDDDGKKGNKIILSNEDIKEYKELKGYNSKFSVRKEFTTDYEVIRLVENKNNETLLRINFNAKPEKDSKVTETNKTKTKDLIKRTAKEAKVSESLILSLIESEGIRYKSYVCPGKRLTIAIGHTDSCRNDDPLIREYKEVLDDNQVFKLLEDDLKEIKKCVVGHIGKKNFNSLPLCVQALCIDYFFHTGQPDIFRSDNFKANLKNGNYGAIVISLWRPNYIRRSVNTLYLGLEGLTPKQQKAAVNKLKNSGYYNKACSFLKDNEERNKFIKFCNNIENK